MTREEFERWYAEGCGMTVEQLHELNLRATKCDDCTRDFCLGWYIDFIPLKTRAEAAEQLLRDTLEAVCTRDGISLESHADPGMPARNYELMDRLGIGRIYGRIEPDRG